MVVLVQEVMAEALAKIEPLNGSISPRFSTNLQSLPARHILTAHGAQVNAYLPYGVQILPWCRRSWQKRWPSWSP